jgi:hypothetical protein
MRKYKQLILLLAVSFLISACGSRSGLGYQDGHLYVQMEDVVMQMQETPVAKKRTNFKSLFLNQTVLRTKAGNLWVYEDARTDFSYEFEPTMMRTLDVIFETRRKIPVYARAHLHAYQVILPSGQILNVIVQQDDSQHLKLLYGMSTQELNRILKQIDPSAPLAHYTQVVTIKDPRHAILTKWDDMKVHFYPLVVPLPRLMMGF